MWGWWNRGWRRCYTQNESREICRTMFLPAFHLENPSVFSIGELLALLRLRLRRLMSSRNIVSRVLRAISSGLMPHRKLKNSKHHLTGTLPVPLPKRVIVKVQQFGLANSDLCSWQLPLADEVMNRLVGPIPGCVETGRGQRGDHDHHSRRSDELRLRRNLLRCSAVNIGGSPRSGLSMCSVSLTVPFAERSEHVYLMVRTAIDHDVVPGRSGPPTSSLVTSQVTPVDRPAGRSDVLAQFLQRGLAGRNPNSDSSNILLNCAQDSGAVCTHN